MIIYKVTNIVNKKIYIGSTINSLTRRKSSHLTRSRSSKPRLLFHRALKKWGMENFEWEIIERCIEVSEMYDMEYHYIKQYNSLAPNGYNLTEGYDNTTTGYRFTEKQRSDHSKRMMGESNGNFGNKWSEEKKKALSKKMLGKFSGDNNPAKRESSKKKISEAVMGEKNVRALKWLMISPEGKEFRFVGGIKRKMTEFGLTYSNSAQKHIKGLVPHYKGWIIKKEEKNESLSS